MGDFRGRLTLLAPLDGRGGEEKTSRGSSIDIIFIRPSPTAGLRLKRIWKSPWTLGEEVESLQFPCRIGRTTRSRDCQEFEDG